MKEERFEGKFERESEYARVPLKGIHELDPTMAELIGAEAERQDRKLIFIASESICPPAVRRVMASPLCNIYAEGYPAPRMNVLTEEELADFDDAFVNFRRYSDRRYYKGTDYMNVIESLAKRRCSDLFANDRVSSEQIFANVQSLSGAAANNAVYQAFLQNGDRILGMSLVSGGHLTHGSPVNRSGRTYEVASYSVGKDGRLDYDAIEAQAKEFKPRLIVAGFSAYPWDIDWAALKKAADSVGAILMADISHTAGLVAAGAVNSPVGFADVMTFTTHKTLCGPRGAVIITTDETHAKAVDLAVFPGEQGGPHMHQIASKAVAFKLAASEEFKTTMKKVVSNANSMAESFKKRGLKLAYGGTDTHLLLLDLRKVKTASGKPITGEIASRLLDNLGITCNKNTIAGDTSANNPSGLRFGTVWVTQRGFGPEELDKVADLVSMVLQNAHSYNYFYAGGDVGRAKLDFDIMEEVEREIDVLVRKTGDVKGDWEWDYPHYGSPICDEDETPIATPLAAPALEGGLKSSRSGNILMVESYGDNEKEHAATAESAGLLDLGKAEWTRVTGRRAALFLESALTADIVSLKPGEGTAALVLNAQGGVICDAAVLCEDSSNTSRSWSDSFLVRLGPVGDGRRGLRWLRSLSDGYAYHDKDIYLKAEGPAVLSSLNKDGSVFTALAIMGPDAVKTAAKALGKTEKDLPRPGGHLRLKIESGDHARDVHVFRRQFNKREVIETAGPAQTLVNFWTRLMEAGGTMCGSQTGGESWTGTRLYGCGYETCDPARAQVGPDKVIASPMMELVDADKPFFVGQKPFLEAAEKSEFAEIKKALKPIEREDWAGVLDVKPQTDRTTCLYEEHQKLAGKRNIVPFAGWKMPVWYKSISAEHEAVRTGAGLFDVSHMGILSFTGKHAEKFLDLITTNYVPWLNPGQCQYSYLLDPEGKVLDDIIIYRESRDRFMMVVNAANAETDETWIHAIKEGMVPLDPSCPHRKFKGEVEIRNMKLDESLGQERRVDLALQGPASLVTLHALMSDETEKRKLAELPSFHLMQVKIHDMRFWIANTGYTGETVGFELFPHPDNAVELWNMILEAGKERGVVPTGLGARDSTRLEAGFPLHGHELAGSHNINPLEAGYAPFVRLHKPYFIGRTAMLDAYENWNRTIVRLQTTQTGGRTIRAGAPVVDARRGTCVGTVTSCVTIDRYQVGLALVDRKKTKLGDQLLVYPVSEGAKKQTPKAPEELEPGDRTSIPLEAKVISRFMAPGETRSSALEDQ